MEDLAFQAVRGIEDPGKRVLSEADEPAGSRLEEGRLVRGDAFSGS